MFDIVSTLGGGTQVAVFLHTAAKSSSGCVASIFSHGIQESVRMCSEHIVHGQ